MTRATKEKDTADRKRRTKPECMAESAGREYLDYVDHAAGIRDLHNTHGYRP